MGLGSFFGFGRGKLTIQLEKYQFIEGEHIQGKIIIKLKKPIEANGVKVNLKAMEKRRVMNRVEYTKIYDQDFPIVQQPTPYGPGEHTLTFDIIAPSIPQPGQASGFAGQVMNVMKSFSSRTINWKLKAQVDVPSAVDMRKKVKIDIQPKPQEQTEGIKN